MDLSDETIIGEGVVLDTASASLGSRTAAALIDAVIYLALAFGMTFLLAFILPSSLDAAAIAAITLAATVLIFVGIPVTVETLTRGKSLGKLALGIRIVRDDGGPIAMRQAFVRAMTGVIELWLTSGAVALVASVTNKRGKRIGDMIAGTYALQARIARHQHAPLVMPYELAGWAAAADVRRLPDGLALEARQFLTRAHLLHPASRAGLAFDIATKMSPYVAPAAPEHTHPEAFITAILVTRRDKEFALQSHQLSADAAQSALVHRLPHQVQDILD